MEVLSTNTKQSVEHYLKGNLSNVLLLGREGLAQREVAFHIAYEFLFKEEKNSDSSMDNGCKFKKLLVHPDFALFEKPNDNKSTIGVDAAAAIIRRTTVKPSIGEKMIFIVDHFELFTNEAQNKLLKLIEETSHIIFIGIAYDETLLDTIKSRLCTIVFEPLSYSQFNDYCKQNNIEDVSLLFALTKGAYGMIPTLVPNIDTFKNLYQALISYDVVSILDTLDLISEKDRKKGFFTNNKTSTLFIFNMIEMVFHSMLCDKYLLPAPIVKNNDKYDIVQLCSRIEQTQKERRRFSKSTSYSLDDFFEYVRTVLI